IHLPMSVDRGSDAQLIHLKRLPRIPLPGVWLLPAAKRVDINRQRLDCGKVEAAHPCRQNAGRPVADGFYEGCLIRTIKPDLVREVRRPEFLISLARIAVAR